MQAKVVLSVRDEWITVAVSDEGKGIAKEEIDKIFQPFYRTGNSRAANGFGLGLSLATRIVKLHKGEIEVVSQPGSGTEFTIKLLIAGASQNRPR